MDLEPCARRDRPRSRTALVQHFRFLLCGTSAAVVIAAHPASRSKTANTFQLGAKDSVGIQMRGVNKWLSMQPASVQFLPLKKSRSPSQSCSPTSVGGL